ncbi:MAG: hypothetical protein VB139_01345 [Coriobacteriia bacterium]|nr:hypothetical protein [Coriobacteriia bacterium]
MSRLVPRCPGVRVILAVNLLIALVPGCAHAAASGVAPRTSTELVASPAEFDGEAVAFTGEVIGESMERGDMAWLHLNDDAYRDRNVEEGAPLGGYNSGMAVWIPAEAASTVVTFGDHAHEGDVVRISGTFNAACPEHGGDMDIHASSLEVVTPGHRVDDPVDPGKVVWAIVLSMAALVAFLADRLRARAEDTRGM